MEVDAYSPVILQIANAIFWTSLTPLKGEYLSLSQPPESFGDDLDYPTNIVQMTSASIPAYVDPLDDVFGSDPGVSDHAPNEFVSHGHSDMSLDSQRLRSQHNTVGYREGITAGKAGSIQAGFDQGFALGANIGMKAGQLLGLLEGIRAALSEAGPADEAVRIEGLLAQATAQLNPESLFTPEFWASDGTWTYPVVPSHEGGEITYPDVADQHPLISKWSLVVCREADRWQVDQALPILEKNETSTQEDDRAPEIAPKPEITSRDAIEW
ncbi:hypothetical protein F4808DRAFT_450130 [Astrocystis sublimbata]|nr:hypothetical protein F4808DRAFT_450130 [Astrocystis sublimbata]